MLLTTPFATAYQSADPISTPTPMSMLIVVVTYGYTDNAAPATMCGQRPCFLPYTNSTKPIPLGMSDRNSHVGSRFMRRLMITGDSPGASGSLTYTRAVGQSLLMNVRLPGFTAVLALAATLGLLAQQTGVVARPMSIRSAAGDLPR